jgi:hypothetical protein
MGATRRIPADRSRAASARRPSLPDQHGSAFRFEWVAIGGTAVALFVFLYAFTIDQPFHVDTTVYFESMRDLRAGGPVCRYATRCMVFYTLIPFSILGAHAVKAGFIAAATGFFLFSYLFMSRSFSKPAAYVSSLTVICAPAGLITITQLKEDFVGLMFVAAALFLTSRSLRNVFAWALSPIAFAFSLLSKETFLLFTPFYFLVSSYHLFGLAETGVWRAVREPRRWLRFAASAAIVAGTTFVIQPDYVASLRALTESRYLGQFMGLLSDVLPNGFALFRRGLGNGVLFWWQLLAVVPLVLAANAGRRVLYVVFAANAILIGLFSMNTSVMTYRNFVAVSFLTMPMAMFGLETLLLRLATSRVARAATYALGACAVVAYASRSLPYVKFHSRFNPQASFFDGLKPVLGPRPVLLTMDYAGLVHYFLPGVETMSHVPNPSEEQAAQFVDALRRAPDKTYYILPDLRSYDSRKTIARHLETTFRSTKVYEGWYEDYHAMDFGEDEETVRDLIAKKTGCTVTDHRDGTVALGPLELDELTYEIACSDHAEQAKHYGSGGRVFSRLTRAPLMRLIAR